MAREAQFQLSLGRMLSQSFSVYLRNLIPFLLFGTLMFTPWIVLRVLGAETEVAARTPITLVAMLLQMLLGQLLTGALTYGVVQQLRGQTASIGEVLGHGAKSFLRVLGTGLLSGLLIGLGSLLIVPGIIFAVRFYVAVPVAVMEGKSGSAAMSRSADLVRGSGWTIFGAFLLIILVAAILGGVIGAILAIRSDGSVEAALESLWFEVPIQILMSTFGATIMAVTYFQLRKGKENVDAQDVAAVFD